MLARDTSDHEGLGLDTWWKCGDSSRGLLPGTVEDENGAPLKDIEIHLSRARSNSAVATTDAQGGFEVCWFPFGNGPCEGDPLVISVRQTSESCYPPQCTVRYSEDISWSSWPAEGIVVTSGTRSEYHFHLTGRLAEPVVLGRYLRSACVAELE